MAAGDIPELPPDALLGPPHPGPPTALPVTVVINTCAPYAGVTLPPLFASLRGAGVAVEDVVVVCGQADPAGQAGQAGVHHPRLHCVPTSYVDFTALCYVAGNPRAVPTEWALFLNDTVLVRNDFADHVRRVHDTILRTTSADVVTLLDMYSMSMGFVRVAWLAARGQEFAGLPVRMACVDDVRRVKMRCEDELFQGARREHLGSFARDRRVAGTTSYTPGGARRLVEVYPFIGVVKLKSWYGQQVPVKETAQGPLLEAPVGV